MEVSDARVTSLINSHFGVPPTRKEFQEIRTGLRINGRTVGETELFDAIRGEIRHTDMFALLQPGPTPLPADAWELYRKLNQTANVAYVELPASEFVAAAPEPNEGEVTALFDEYRDREPDPITGLGFRRPSQVSLGYLKADRKAVLASISDPTDEDVARYYEENKAAEYRNPAYDDWFLEQQRMETRDEVDAALDANAPPAPASPPPPSPSCPRPLSPRPLSPRRTSPRPPDPPGSPPRKKRWRSRATLRNRSPPPTRPTSRR